MGNPDHGDDRESAESGLLALGFRYAGIATQFALTLAVLGYVGFRADERYGWSPWGVLTGIFAGMALGLTAMLKQLQKMESLADRKRPKK